MMLLIMRVALALHCIFRLTSFHSPIREPPAWRREPNRSTRMGRPKMEGTSSGNAMTEIALALAMAFFSIMVLTMVSMGVAENKTPAVAGAMLAPAADDAKAAAVKPRTDDVIVVYHGGRFYNRDLQPVDPSSINTSGRALLALSPALPMGEAIAVRTQINVSNLIVSTLDSRWLKTLEGMTHDR